MQNKVLPPLSPAFDADAFLSSKESKDLRYDNKTKRWYVWNGTIWQPADDDDIKALAQNQLLHYYATPEAQDLGTPTEVRKHRRSVAGPRYMGDVVSQISQRSDARYTDWDSRRYLLPVANGVVDLQTATITGHDRTFYRTWALSTHYTRSGTGRWEDLVLQYCSGDVALARYLKVAMGYSLLGLANQKSIFYIYGPSDTAKSTFLNMIAAVVGDLGDVTTSLRNSSDHRATREALSRFEDKRFMFLPECQKGFRWTSESKSISGGDKIEVHQNYVGSRTYTPKVAMWAASNYYPAIDPDDDANWNRMRVIPFLNVIPRSAANRALAELAQPDKADSMAPEILTWMIDGAQEFIVQGMAPEPECVTLHTKAARDGAVQESPQATHTAQQFVKECLRPADESEYVLNTDAFAACGRYTASRGWKTPGAETVGKAMTAAFGKGQSTTIGKLRCRRYFGCRLVEPQTNEQIASMLLDYSTGNATGTAHGTVQ